MNNFLKEFSKEKLFKFKKLKMRILHYSLNYSIIYYINLVK